MQELFENTVVGGITMREHLERNQKIVAAFSGGKDAIVLAHLLREYKDKIDFVWVNTGAMFPHMEKFVRSHSEQFNLVEIRSDVFQYIQQVGLPTKIIPIKLTPYGRINLRGQSPEQPLVNDWLSCCLLIRSKPIFDHAAKIGARLIIQAQRAADLGGFPEYQEGANGQLVGGIYQWSDDQVYDYIKEHNLRLPEQYYYGVVAGEINREADSLECWNCTTEYGEFRAKYMADKYPELLGQVRSNVELLREEITLELNQINSFINVSG